MEDHVRIDVAPEVRASDDLLAAVVYRSRARRGLGAAEVGVLLAAARERNAAEGLTGLLLYDGEHFFQWLEGPSDAVHRIWADIRRDPRHSEVELLGRPRLPLRLFAGWDMGLAGASRALAEGVDDIVLVDAPCFQSLESAGRSLGPILDIFSRLSPDGGIVARAMAPSAAEDHVRVLCLDHVLPMLQARHGIAPGLAARAVGGPSALPRIDPAFIERFADQLRSEDDASIIRVWDRLRGIGVSADALCGDLIEPVARHLGDLWADDVCSGADLTIAVSELLRLVSSGRAPGAPSARADQPRVLVCSPPGALNLLGPALASLRLESMHFSTECLYPDTDAELDEHLFDHDFDALLIAMDPVHTHSADTRRLDATVLEARAATHNRGLQVLLYGRQVSVEPGIAARTHTDSAFATLAELYAVGRSRDED